MEIMPLVVAFALAATAGSLIGSPTITDGDTIRIGSERIRLEGIDAPETHQKCQRTDGSEWLCGEASKDALSRLVGDRTVRCEISGLDRYGRSLGICWLRDLDVNEWMVRSGWAVAYRRYSLRYVTDEDKARQARLNIWSGNFDMPWVWRAAHRR